jgi:hypothetical protein
MRNTPSCGFYRRSLGISITRTVEKELLRLEIRPCDVDLLTDFLHFNCQSMDKERQWGISLPGVNEFLRNSWHSKPLGRHFDCRPNGC